MADKPVIDALASTSRHTTTGMNQRFQALADEFENVLGREGSNGQNNTMRGNIDMGGFRVTGLGAPVSDNDAVRLIDLESAGGGSGGSGGSLELVGMLSVSDYGAVGDGMTDDTTAIAAAISAVGTTKSKWMWWPTGIYLTTTSLANLHTIKHMGPGIIKRGTNLFYPSIMTGTEQVEAGIDQVEAFTNKLYVDSAVSDAVAPGTALSTNDGLSSSQPVTLSQINGILSNYGPHLAGNWKVYFVAARTIYENCTIDNLSSENWIHFIGYTPGGAPNYTPTTVLDGSAGTGHAAKGVGMYFRYGMRVKVKDIMFQNYTLATSTVGLLLESRSDGYFYNIHSTGNSYCGIKVSDGCHFYLTGGRHVSNGEYHIVCYGNVLASIGYNGDTLPRPYFGTILNTGSGGIYFVNQVSGHIDYCDFENIAASGGAIQLQNSSRAHTIDCTFATNYYNIRMDNGSTYFDGPTSTFGATTTGTSVAAWGFSVRSEDSDKVFFNETNGYLRLGPDGTMTPQAILHIIEDRVTSPSGITYNSNTMLALECDSATGNPYMSFGASDDGSAGIYFTSASGTTTQGTLQYVFTDNTFRLNVDTNAEYIWSATNFYPYVDNVNECGSSVRRWSKMWATEYGLGAGNLKITTNAGSPEGAVTAAVGSICSDTTNGKLYVKATGVGNTGWVVAGTQT